MKTARLSLVPSILLIALACSSAVLAQAPSGNGSGSPARDGSASPAARYFTDVVLVNQDGEQMRFYSDLLQGKVVVINTIFTTCTGICPLISKTFAQLQEHLGERLGRDVHLISISVDPLNDTSQRLKQFGARFGAKPGWHFLTGRKENLELTLYKLGQTVKDKESHQNVILIGNEPTGLWKKAFGLAPAAEIIKIVDSVLDDRMPEG